METNMISFLQTYLNIDTSHPKPRYKKAIALFTQQAQRDGFQTSVIQLPSGFKVLVITMQGVDNKLPTLALNHHMDVVPPFCKPHIDGNKIYGRGTQDMKGVGVAHYFALKEMKNKKHNLRRTVHLILVPEEELGGFSGAGQLIKTDAFKKLNIGFVLDEGIPSGKDDMLLIKIAERKPIQIEFTSTGTMAHGSKLNCNNAINQLVLFLSRLAQLQEIQKKRIGHTEPGLLLSINLTSLNAGVFTEKGEAVLNVIPDKAIATADIRVPPTMDIGNVIAQIQQELIPFPTITYTIKAQANERSFDSQCRNILYEVVEKTIVNMGLQAKPHFAQESSDLRFYLEQNIQGLGLTPFTIKENIHGDDECIRIEDMITGKNLFFNFLEYFCT